MFITELDHGKTGGGGGVSDILGRCRAHLERFAGLSEAEGLPCHVTEVGGCLVLFDSADQ